MWSYVLSDLNWAHFLTLNIKKYYIKKVPVYCRSNDRKQFYIHLLRYFWYWLVIRSDKSKYIWITWWFVCRIPSSKPVYACKCRSLHDRLSYENESDDDDNWCFIDNFKIVDSLNQSSKWFSLSLQRFFLLRNMRREVVMGPVQKTEYSFKWQIFRIFSNLESKDKDAYRVKRIP